MAQTSRGPMSSRLTDRSAAPGPLGTIRMRGIITHDAAERIGEVPAGRRQSRNHACRGWTVPLTFVRNPQRSVVDVGDGGRSVGPLGNFLRCLALPRKISRWSLTTLREKLINNGAKMIVHA